MSIRYAKQVQEMWLLKETLQILTSLYQCAGWYLELLLSSCVAASVGAVARIAVLLWKKFAN